MCRFKPSNLMDKPIQLTEYTEFSPILFMVWDVFDMMKPCETMLNHIQPC